MPCGSSSSSYPLTDNCSPPSTTRGVIANGPGWVGWPPELATDLQAYCWLIQLWQVAREKGYPFGNLRFPSLTESDIGRGMNPSSSSSSGGVPINAGGIVGSITFDEPNDQYIVSDSSAWWIGHCGDRLVNYVCTPADPTIPSNYDVMFEVRGSEDWTGVCRANVVGQDSPNSFRIGRELEDIVTGGYLDEIEDVVGCKMYFIRANEPAHPSLWWADVANVSLGRWPQFPQWELDKGTGSGNVGGTFSAEKRRWKPGLFDGKELLVYGADGRLQRLTITCNDERRLYLGDFCPSSSSSSPSSSSSGTSSSSSSGLPISGKYIIVEAGGKGMPQRTPWMPKAWYGGATWSQRGPLSQSLNPLDAMADYPSPVASVVWEVLDCTAGPLSCHCEDEGHPGDGGAILPNGALDIDVWSEPGNECDSDHPYAPLLYKTVRSIQNYIFSLAPLYIEAKDNWDNFAPHEIPPLAVARMFELDNTNSWRTTITSVAGYCGGGSSSSSGMSAVAGTATLAAGFAPTPEILPTGAWFAVYDAKGGLQVHGYGSYNAPSATSSSSSGGASGFSLNGNGITTDHCGMTVVLSLGFSRYLPRSFKYLFGKCVFIPSLCKEAAKYPPSPCDYCCEDQDDPPLDCCRDCSGVGTWINRPDPSFTYCEPDEFGRVLPNGINFVAGELATYEGDAWDHPTDGRENWSGNPDDAQTAYYTHFYRGQHTEKHEADIQDQLHGVASDGGVGFIQDTSKDWWNPIWYSIGGNRIDSGTATGGSTITLIDTTKRLDALTDDYNAPCYWQAERFVGWTADTAFTDFVLEVEVDPDNAPDVWEKRPIILGVSSTQTLTVAPAFSKTTNGKRYRIREPFGELNRWKGRRLRLFPNTCYGSSSSSSGGSGGGGMSSSSSSTCGHSYREVTVTHSDRDTLYWAESEGVTAGACWRYVIVDPPTGGVWQFATTPPADCRQYVKIAANKYWVEPVGNDVSRRGVQTPKAFHKRKNENAASIVKRYGNFMLGDYFAIEFFTQMYKAFNRMEHTKHTTLWVGGRARSAGFGFSDDGIAICNCDPDYSTENIYSVTKGGGTFNCTGGTFQTETAHGIVYDWANLYPIGLAEDDPAEGEAPSASASCGAYDDWCVGSCGEGIGEDRSAGGGCQTTYSKQQGTLPATLLPCSVDFYNYAGHNTADEDSDVMETNTSGTMFFNCFNGTGLTSAPPNFPTHSKTAFNDLGFPVLYHKWKKWSSKAIVAGADTTIRTDDTLGSPDMPPLPPDPSFYHPGGDSNTYSYRVFFGVMIAKWTMSFVG